MNTPLVSVIIPVFNGERFLEQALSSVLSQGYGNLELIVVDDGSTDRSREIIQRTAGDIRYLYQENTGPSAARNRALEVARGSIIAFQDADDIWPDGKLELQLPKLIADPGLEIVMGQVQRIKEPENEAALTAFENLGTPVLAVNLAASMFRKSIFDRVGMFNEGMRFSEDVDWFMRAREHGAKMSVMEAVTLLYRRHGQNMTAAKNLTDLNAFKVLKMSLDRRRCESGFAGSLPALANPAERSDI